MPLITTYITSSILPLILFIGLLVLVTKPIMYNYINNKLYKSYREEETRVIPSQLSNWWIIEMNRIDEELDDDLLFIEWDKWRKTNAT